MEFTQKELLLIDRSVRKARDARITRAILLIGMIAATACMVAGLLDGDTCAFGLIVAVLIAVAHPQLGGGPKYEDLAELLSKKSAGTAASHAENRPHHDLA